MANIFNKVQVSVPKTNSFDLSYDHTLSFNMGELIPIHIQEVLPGTTNQINCSSLLRFAPLIAPVMHKVDVFTHFFFVPTRLIWDGWEDFITGNLPAEQTPVAPYFDAGNIFQIGSVADHMGLPTGVACPKISALQFAAYNKVYNDYYRDQNLIEPIQDECQDGSNSGYLPVSIRKRAWQHDYFTSSLPWAQKGESVLLPLGDAAPVFTNKDTEFGIQQINVANPSPNNTPVYIERGLNNTIDPSYLYADLSDATSATINDLRTAFRLQEWLEKNARGGTRYIESILAHFGVRSSDARLQRSEYLGGTKNPMVISEVLQTSESVDTPQANMAGHGISAGTGRASNYYAEEYGYIIGIISVMPRTKYQQGLPKQFFKFDRFDYAFPEFAHLGEQEVKNKELYVTGTSRDEETFGYLPRYAEYRFIPSRVSGEFKTTLSYWHLGRIFDSPPSLNQSFIECNPSRRIFAVEDGPEDTIYAHIFFKIRSIQKLPKYGTPGGV